MNIESKVANVPLGKEATEHTEEEESFFPK
jgi:hypothetical protein